MHAYEYDNDLNVLTIERYHIRNEYQLLIKIPIACKPPSFEMSAKKSHTAAQPEI